VSCSLATTYRIAWRRKRWHSSSLTRDHSKNVLVHPLREFPAQGAISRRWEKLKSIHTLAGSDNSCKRIANLLQILLLNALQSPRWTMDRYQEEYAKIPVRGISKQRSTWAHIPLMLKRSNGNSWACLSRQEIRRCASVRVGSRHGSGEHHCTHR